MYPAVLNRRLIFLSKVRFPFESRTKHFAVFFIGLVDAGAVKITITFSV